MNDQNRSVPPRRPAGQGNPPNSAGRAPQSQNPQNPAGRAAQPQNPPNPTGRVPQPQKAESGPPPVRPQSVRRANPLPPDQSIIARDFHKRLHGKPTHATRIHTWYGTLSGGAAFFLKIFVVIILLFTFIVGGFGGGMLVGYISTAKPLDTSELLKSDKKQTTFVYDIEGNIIEKLTGSDNVDRIYVSYSEVKDTYIDEAIISIEDERFYDHNGIDIQRIASAVFSALSNGGTATHGGSTITQQTVKMISGLNQISTQRKVQEWFSAMDLEQKLTKDEIMELYINQAPMGNNYLGVQTAAQNYFGKDAKDLNLSECAFLAGIPKSPSYYNPLRETGKRNAMRRMRVVLGKMYELGKITEAEYHEALNTELLFKTQDTSTAATVQSYFVEYAISEVITDLMAQRNISRSMAASLVYNNGYQIHTTLEPTVQASLDTTFSTEALFQTDPVSIEDLPEKPQSGMVIINNATGAIAAMQGGYGEKTRNLVLNRAVDSFRQPGSSIKPILDYAPAFERKLITTATLYEDTALQLNPADPEAIWPKNASGGYYGTMTVRSAIYKSSNIVAVQVWNTVGGDMALWFLKQVGIDRTAEVYPSTAIGGFNVGMSPLEMASAYATFANDGVYREPFAYTSVTDSSGTVVLEKSVISRLVYSPETSFLMSSMLSDVITRGTAAGKVLPITTDSGEAIAVAGKTGTTDNNVDKWFCGYTPYYSAATWYGYDNRLRTTEIPVDDRSNAQLIWNDAMQAIHKTLTPSAMTTEPVTSPLFVQPETVLTLTICTQSGLLATDSCAAAGTTVTDIFDTKSPLTPTTYCYGHAAPTPVPTEVPVVTAPIEPIVPVQP